MRQLRRSGYFRDHPEKRSFSKPWARRNIQKYLFLTMQRRVNYKTGPQYALKLTYTEFLEEIGGKAPKRCPILGIRLFISPRARSDHLPTVDRIDNSRPYERGNVAIISRRANIIKNGGSAEEHRRIALWMARNKP
jgi:hypothetical protein